MKACVTARRALANTSKDEGPCPGKVLIEANRGRGRIRCDICKKFKDIEQYSKRSLKKYNYRTPNNSGIPCRACSGAPPTEILCEGPCNMVRPLALFSRNSRRSRKNWCEDCTQWQILQEPGEALPPPGHLRGVDEEGETPLSAGRGLVPYQALFEHGISDNSTVVTSGHSVIDYSQVRSVHQEYDGVGFFRLSLAEKDMVPPHLAPRDAPDWSLPAMENRILGTSDAPSSVTSSVPTSNVDPSQKATQNQRSGTFFTAYGPNGERERHIKNPTLVSDSMTTISVQSDSTIKTGKSGWAKPNQRKVHATKPDYLRYDFTEDDAGNVCSANDTRVYVQYDSDVEGNNGHDIYDSD